MKAKIKKNALHHYSSDRPISSKKADLLGRAEFAAHLAKDLLSWNGADSLVVALYGAWGSGKTSVKNMLLESVHRKQSEALTVIEFNPWQWSGTGSISVSFFRELDIALRGAGPARDVEKRSKLLKKYAGALNLTGTAINSVGKVLPLIAVPGGTVLEMVGGAFKGIALAAKGGGEALKAKAESDSKSLHEQKLELAQLLARLPRPLLVVIDDIDRLTTDEVLQVFQLVKANADFPRLIFLLLFEREVVTKALDTVSCNKGGEFLEKIIQVAYHIPRASHAAIQKVLFDGLDAQIDMESISKRWNQQRWSRLYYNGISHYFTNLRNVYRYLAAFSFHAHHHRSGSSFEVNPVDLVGLETLRMFEPAVYERLPSAKTVLTRSGGSHQFGGLKQEVVDEVLGQITAHATSDGAASVKDILGNLFPTISSHSLDWNGESQDQGRWFRDLRVCHSEVFDKYFTLTIGDGDLTQAELDHLIQKTAEVQAFVNACGALQQRGLLELAFARLENYKEHIPLENMPSLIEGLCEIGDGFPRREPGGSVMDLEFISWRLVYFGLRRESDMGKRLATLQSAFSKTKGLALPIHIVSLDERVGDRVSRGHRFLVDESGLAVLKQMCAEKLRVALRSARFREDPRLSEYLWQWSRWESVEAVKAWLSDHTTSANGAAWFLSVLLNRIVTTRGDGSRTTSYRLRLADVEHFSDVTALSETLERADLMTLSEKESNAVREFHKAMKRRAEGKTDETWDDTHDEGYE